MTAAKPSRPWFKKKRWWAVGIVLLLIVIGAATGEGKESEASATPEPTATVETTGAPEATESPVVEAEPEPEVAEPEPEPEVTEPEMTGGQRNAVRSAESYLGYSAFSRSGLIGQLEYEGFSTKQATYGVDQTDL